MKSKVFLLEIIEDDERNRTAIVRNQTGTVESINSTRFSPDVFDSWNNLDLSPDKPAAVQPSPQAHD